MANIKNSTYNATNGRYVLGGITEVSSFAIESWEMKPLAKDASDIIYVVEKKYEGRLDLLGILFYGDAALWWIIAQYNGIIDPLEELVEGKLVLVPLKARVQAQMLSIGSKIGGIASTRT